jgi:hypothetical protein
VIVGFLVWRWPTLRACLCPSLLLDVFFVFVIALHRCRCRYLYLLVYLSGRALICRPPHCSLSCSTIPWGVVIGLLVLCCSCSCSCLCCCCCHVVLVVSCFDGSGHRCFPRYCHHIPPSSLLVHFVEKRRCWWLSNVAILGFLFCVYSWWIYVVVCCCQMRLEYGC